MSGLYLLIATFIIIAIVLITIVLVLFQKYKIKTIREQLELLDKEKNLIASTPVMSELAKVEPIIKNDKMGEKYKNWQHRFEIIKDDKITNINDMIIELDMALNQKDYKVINAKLAKTEIEIYKARESANELLDEIKEITLSEEKYRSIVTKLKAKYRSLLKEFNNHREDYEDIADVIELQFENIEKRFLDFDNLMEKNEYDEVTHIVKALDNMIDHMAIVISEVPNLVLLSEKLIPRRIEEIENNYNQLVADGYPLAYLKIEYNMEESRKNTKNILDRIKVLNLEDCMFELKTILDYLDSTFTDFEKETYARKVYEETSNDFNKDLKKGIKIVKDIYHQIDDIKSMYDLKDKDIESLNDISKSFNDIKKEYKKLNNDISNKEIPYSDASKEINLQAMKLKKIEEELDTCLHSLGSMYDDETRAREQLDEIQELLKQCKLKIRSYKLPIIMNNYFVELAEANEAIGEIIKELEKKPIVIKVLNTRVDTARDLILKLYGTTNEMIRTARLAELSIVYGNKYRSSVKEIDAGLTNAEMLFHKGEYSQALDVSLSSIEMVEPDIYDKLKKHYEEER